MAFVTIGEAVSDFGFKLKGFDFLLIGRAVGDIKMNFNTTVYVSRFRADKPYAMSREIGHGRVYAFIVNDHENWTA
ncbi:hypothetical protein THMIRHAM_01430 [Thiomicrorhabdus immobilis]|uniref:Uncharacterized protein n=1 Tax=Thiomicrorhabdus immobilis TaxID=2791037 RepID=A0ABM7MAL2_9GAMM|nr:hypothetical protein THMIRHAM_01430 [Thiomicrorhabdus immobilis]